jgi:hypothetical protein
MSYEANELMSPQAPSDSPASAPGGSNAGSGVWATPGRADLEALTHAVHTARSVLGALGVNAEWLRSQLADHPVLGAKDALDDIVTCCARLNALIEDAFRAANAAALKSGREVGE